MQGFQESAGESGTLYNSKVSQGEQALGYTIANSRVTMRLVFNYVDKMLQVHLTLPRMIRIVGANGDQQWLSLNEKTVDGVKNDLSQGDYDFRADVSSMGKTAKQMKFLEGMELAKNLADTGFQQLILWPDLIGSWDSPMAKKWQEYAAQQMGMQEQAKQQQMQVAQVQQRLGLAGQVKQLAEPPPQKKKVAA